MGNRLGISLAEPHLVVADNGDTIITRSVFSVLRHRKERIAYRVSLEAMAATRLAE